MWFGIIDVVVKAAYRYKDTEKETEKGIEHLKRVDKVLAEVIEKVGKFEMSREEDEFLSLVDAICSQQLSGKAAAKILERVEELFPGGMTAERVLKTSDEALRGAGLSRAKVVYVKDLAGRVVKEELDLGKLREMDDEEVVKELVKVKGIGRWTAEMFLMFTLGRLDVLPVDDLGIRKAFNILYGKGRELGVGRMEEIARKWRPYRTVACWYLWRSLE